MLVQKVRDCYRGCRNILIMGLSTLCHNLPSHQCVWWFCRLEHGRLPTEAFW